MPRFSVVFFFMPRQWTVAEIVGLGKDFPSLLAFLASFGILEVPVQCDCGGALKVADHRGQKCFRCAERKCRKRVSVRCGSVLDLFRIPLATWLLLVYLWAVRTSFSAAVSLSGVSKTTVARVYCLLRLCCKKCRDGYGRILGGVGSVVSVDETDP